MGGLLDVPVHRLMERLSAQTAAQLDLVYVAKVRLGIRQMLIAHVVIPTISQTRSNSSTSTTLFGSIGTVPLALLIS